MSEKGKFRTDSLLVKLHGLVHTDDKLALKSITFQMKLDNAVDGKVFGSFAENLVFLLGCLRGGEKRCSKSVIFVLEDFDLFCAHHNQTLLYNLFDISQSAQTPICVLGITCRLDVIQLLEKRVKSRFSHRQMFIYPGPEDESKINQLDSVLVHIKWYLEIPYKARIKISENRRKEWNQALDLLLKDKKFKNIIQRLIDLELNFNSIKHFLLKCICLLSNNISFSVVLFENELNLLEKDEIINTLRDLSVLELCLIIAMKHHCDIYDNQPMNFEMVYNRYVKFANKHASIQTIQRPVVMKAFEHIENLELISLINCGNSRVQKEYQFFKLMVTSQQLSEAIGKFCGLPTEVLQWANSSLT